MSTNDNSKLSQSLRYQGTVRTLSPAVVITFTRLNPFDIRARSGPLTLRATTLHWSLNPFDIRARSGRVLLLAQREVLVSIPSISGHGPDIKRIDQGDIYKSQSLRYQGTVRTCRWTSASRSSCLNPFDIRARSGPLRRCIGLTTTVSIPSISGHGPDDTSSKHIRIAKSQSLRYQGTVRTMQVASTVLQQLSQSLRYQGTVRTSLYYKLVAISSLNPFDIRARSGRGRR